MELNTNCGHSGLRQECVASEKNTAVSLVVVQFDIKGKGIFKFCSESCLWAFKSVFMPPTLKKLVGHIALGLSVCPHHFFLTFKRWMLVS